MNNAFKAALIAGVCFMFGTYIIGCGNPNLVNCRTCGGKVAKVAKTCPNCGAPVWDLAEFASARERTQFDTDVTKIIKLVGRMSARGGQTPSRIKEITGRVESLQYLKRNTPDAKNAQMFDQSLQRLIPKLQLQIDVMASGSDSIEEFETKFGGEGKKLAMHVAELRGIPWSEYREEIGESINPLLSVCRVCRGMIAVEARECPHCGAAHLLPPKKKVTTGHNATQADILEGKEGPLKGIGLKDDDPNFEAQRKYLAGDMATSDIEKARKAQKDMWREDKTAKMEAKDVLDKDFLKRVGKKARDPKYSMTGDRGVALINKELKKKFGDSMKDDEREDLARQLYDDLKKSTEGEAVKGTLEAALKKNIAEADAASVLVQEYAETWRKLGFTSDQMKTFMLNIEGFKKIQKAASDLGNKKYSEARDDSSEGEAEAVQETGKKSAIHGGAENRKPQKRPRRRQRRMEAR